MAESKTSGATIAFAVTSAVLAVGTAVFGVKYFKLRKTVMDYNKVNDKNIGDLGKSS